MQNLFLLPTKKPSRLHLWFDINGTRLEFCELEYSHTRNTQHIYITSDEEIKEGDWVVENHTFKREPYVGKCFYPKNDGTVTDDVIKRDLLSVNCEGHYETLARKHNCKKIILTTDPDLIEDGVQTIDDEFLEWFMSNLSCEFVETKLVEFEVDMGLGDECIEQGNYYKIILPEEETKTTPTENPPIKNGDVYDIGQTVNGVSRFLFFNEKWYYFEERLSRECRKDKSELTKLVKEAYENDFNEVKFIGNIFTLNFFKDRMK